MASHLLIGPGKFGLGFAGDLFSRVGKLNTVILSRSPSSHGKSSTDAVLRDECLARHKSYRLCYDGTTFEEVGGVEILQCDYLEPSAQALFEFTKDDLRIITVSVPEGGLQDIAALLAKGIQERLRARPESEASRCSSVCQRR